MVEVSSSETPSSAAEEFGPYFFAWADEGDAFDPYLHARFDDDIFDFNLTQQEGDFAALALTVKNPRIGLLAPGRQIWAWFSWWNGVQVVPLFFGRLVGLPDNLDEETVALNFIARPSDYAAQKEAVAATKRVRPYWDGIWFDDATRNDPDNVLESRPEAWHIDRVTHVVSTSNIINGEDGTLQFDETQVFYDSVGLNYAQNPLRSVTMTATVSWDQAGNGVVSPRYTGGMQGSGPSLMSYTGEGLAAGWPKTGDSIGGGWKWNVASAKASGMIDSALVGEIVYPANGGLSFYADGGFDASLGKWGEEFPGGPVIGWAYHVAIPNIKVDWSLGLGWEVSRRKSEVLTFTLISDVQDIVTLPDDGATLALTMQSSEVTNAIDAGGVVPIGSPLARSYFNSDRGAQSIEYLIAIARAHLFARGRAVRVDFEIAFEEAVASGVTLRKNAVISDPRLPGTDVGGKIVSYALSMTNGTQKAQITLGCSIGKDGTQAEVAGTPDYVDDGYVDNGYQTRTGAYGLPFDDEGVAYENQGNVPPNDDGFDFLRNLAGTGVAIGLEGGNGATETQEDALGRFDITVSDTGQVTSKNTRFAELVVTVPDLTGGPFQTNYPVNVTDLKIPRTINLEAESEGASST